MSTAYQPAPQLRFKPAPTLQPTRNPVMSTQYASPLPTSSANSGGWVAFTYIQFGFALFMTGLGIWAMPIELMAKGYILMAMVFTVGATFTLAKTIRDEHEAKRLVNRVEEARTEKLLAEIERR
jgi:hypothetical protein